MLRVRSSARGEGGDSEAKRGGGFCFEQERAKKTKGKIITAFIFLLLVFMGLF
jgi:hypothetical protein